MTFIRPTVTAEGTRVSFGTGAANPAFSGPGTFDTATFETAQTTTGERRKAKYYVQIDSSSQEIEIDMSAVPTSTDYKDGFQIVFVLNDGATVNGMKFLATGFLNLTTDLTITVADDSPSVTYSESANGFFVD